MLTEKIRLLCLGIAVIGTVLFFTACVTRFMYRKKVRSRYEWLVLLDFYQWKPVAQLRSAMSRAKGKEINNGRIYDGHIDDDLALLEAEGLVASRTTILKMLAIKRQEYKLTQNGLKNMEFRKRRAINNILQASKQSEQYR
jgi:Na+-transporting methylmalonyl-CoA/oxaloacetate decarboxylase gamma subunit